MPPVFRSIAVSAMGILLLGGAQASSSGLRSETAASACHLPDSVPFFAVINDKDGYANVRLGQNRKIVDRVKANQVFAVYSVVDTDGWQDWFWIRYADGTRNASSFAQYSGGTNVKDGMMHRSRILPLACLPQFDKKIVPGRSMAFSRGSEKITLALGRLVEGPLYSAGQEPVAPNRDVAVSEEKSWGTEGIPPEELIEIHSIAATVKGRTVAFPDESFWNLYSPTGLEEDVGVSMATDGTLFLQMANGNGANRYSVAWTLKDGKPVSQFIHAQRGFPARHKISSRP